MEYKLLLQVLLACLLGCGRDHVGEFVRAISELAIFFSVSECSALNIDDPDHPGDRLLQLLRDNDIDLNAVEGLRLVVAFRKIRDPADRRMVIELAERLAR